MTIANRMTAVFVLAAALAAAACERAECRMNVEDLCSEICACTDSYECVAVEGYVYTHFDDFALCVDFFEADICGTSIDSEECAEAAMNAQCVEDEEGRALALPAECRD